MPSNLYYAVYDIRDDKTRPKIASKLKDAGLTRIQYSVFCGKLNAQQKKDLQEALKKLVKDKESIYLILSCETCFGKLTTIGKGFDKDYVAGDKPMVV